VLSSYYVQYREPVIARALRLNNCMSPSNYSELLPIIPCGPGNVPQERIPMTQHGPIEHIMSCNVTSSYRPVYLMMCWMAAEEMLSWAHV
jgi:hypothetical protein